MTDPARQMLQQAMQLSVLDRAALVEGLIASLDKPDNMLDTLWLKEAEDRMNAYRAGELAAVDADEVFAEQGMEPRMHTTQPLCTKVHRLLLD